MLGCNYLLCFSMRGSIEMNENTAHNMQVKISAKTYNSVVVRENNPQTTQ